MNINFYDTRIDMRKTILIKEKTVRYQTDGDIDVRSPEIVKELMNTLVSLNVLGEEHLYMPALNSSAKLLGIFLCLKRDSQPNLSKRTGNFHACIDGWRITYCHMSQPPVTKCYT